MTDNTLPLTPELEQEYREALAKQEQMRAYQAALLRHAVYLAIEPIVNSEEFISLHQQISAVRDIGPKDDMFFGIGLDAIYNGMTNLGIQVANWTAPIDPNAPAQVVDPLPTPPAPEGDTNG